MVRGPMLRRSGLLIENLLSRVPIGLLLCPIKEKVLTRPAVRARLRPNVSIQSVRLSRAGFLVRGGGAVARRT